MYENGLNLFSPKFCKLGLGFKVVLGESKLSCSEFLFYLKIICVKNGECQPSFTSSTCLDGVY